MNHLIERIKTKHRIAAEVGVKATVASEFSYSPKSMIAVAVANTAAIDLTSEVVIPEGAERDERGGVVYFGAMKAIYLNHDYDTMPIGTMVNIALREKGWVCQFRLHGMTDESRDVAALYSLGAENPIRGTSIGFARKEGGQPTMDEIAKYGPAEYVTRRWTWIELSVTAQPCNPEAMLLGAETESDDAIRSLETLVRKSIIRRSTAKILGLPNKKPMMIRPALVIGA